jgi:hypothetical protein
VAKKKKLLLPLHRLRLLLHPLPLPRLLTLPPPLLLHPLPLLRLLLPLLLLPPLRPRSNSSPEAKSHRQVAFFCLLHGRMASVKQGQGFT